MVNRIKPSPFTKRAKAGSTYLQGNTRGGSVECPLNCGVKPPGKAYFRYSTPTNLPTVKTAWHALNMLEAVAFEMGGEIPGCSVM